MDAEIPPAGSTSTALRKRKWSPLNKESEEESFTDRSTTEIPEDITNPEALPASDADKSNKRARQLNTSSSARPQEDPWDISKQQADLSRLPPEVLQHVCSFIEPGSLGRLIRVNRTLNALLDPKKPLPSGPAPKGRLSVQTQNEVWASSRKRFLPGFPRPLLWVSELDMWRLLRGSPCQFCGKKSGKQAPALPSSPWNSGPGQDGVRVIWPFAVRSCGPCLSPRLVKDADLYFSTSSVLQNGLPYAYFTPSLNFISSITLRATSPPPGLNLTRYYLKTQVEQLQKEMDDVRSLGSAAAEEWHKGLEVTGQERLTDASRFEHWEATGGFQALQRTKTSNGMLAHDPGLPFKPANSVTAHVQSQSHSNLSRIPSPVDAQVRLTPPGLPIYAPGSVPRLPLQPRSPAPGQHFSTTFQSSAPGMVPFQHISAQRPERSLRDVNQMKIDRCAEIERRCLELVPPIKRSTLMYMDAFAAAVQIPMALNDNAWEVLKDRLISQRDAALRKEDEQLAANKHLQTQAEERRLQEEQLKTARETLEREWEEMQKPVRDKLNTYADELIHSRWNGGDFVTKENAPQFAADVLIFVRRRFFEVLNEEGKLFAAQGLSTRPDTPNNGSNRKLKLENMKWVYDAKIKPLTERYRKELFLCGACDGNPKFYALDAVIQHYAAKHTSALSHGTAVVYWKAEWPAEPPFDPEPMNRSPMRHADLSMNAVSPMYTQNGTNAMPQDKFYPYVDIRSPAYSAHTSAHQNYMLGTIGKPPSLYSVDDDRTQPPAALIPLQETYPGYPGHSNDKSYEANAALGLSPPSPAILSHGLPQRYPAARHSELDRRLESAHHVAPLRAISPNEIAKPSTRTYLSSAPGLHHAPPPPPGQPFGIYNVQIEELARNAREIWDGTDGISGLPSSVRINVIIYHVVLRFAEKYTNEPNLALFTDGLNHNPLMRPLKSLGDLTCKTCALARDGIERRLHGHQSSSAVEVIYTLPELLKHFQSAHIENGIPQVTNQTGLESPRPDWKFDMVQLPAESIIKNLMNAPGITYAKLNLIATVLPRHFPQPLPKIDPVPPAPDTDGSEALLVRQHVPHSRLGSVAGTDYQNEHEGLIAVRGDISQPDRLDRFPASDGRQIVEVVGEDEYDPHRPAPAYYAPIHHERSHRMPVYRSQRSVQRYYEPYVEERSGPPLRRAYAHDNDRVRVVYRQNDYDLPDRRDGERPRYYLDDESSYPTRYPPDRLRTFARLYDEPVRVLDGTNETGRPRTPEQYVKQEARRSPPESPSAAEQFLNNFDTTALEVYGEEREAGGNNLNTVPDRASHNVSLVKDARDLEDVRHDRDRVDDSGRPRTGLSSNRGTPRDFIPLNGSRAHSRSPFVPSRHDIHEDEEYDPRVPNTESYLPLRTDTIPDSRASRLEFVRDSDARQQPTVIEYDREDDLPEDRTYTGRRHLERPVYRSARNSISRYGRTGSYPSHSPEELRYTEVLPRRVHRHPDEDAYVLDDREPVEYIRAPPRERQPSGRYYVERSIIRDPQPEYVEYNGIYGREVVFERDGQLYSRAPPRRRDSRDDRYDDDMRYP